MIQLQDRDIKLLHYLSKYGVLNKTIVDKIYQTKEYTRRRKKRLSDEGYIYKNNKIVYLGTKGRKYLKSVGIKETKQIPGEKYSKERMGKISEILIPLEKIYECYPSWKLKEGNNDKRKLYYGKIINRNNKNEYYVYNIGHINKLNKTNINMKERQIQLTKNEITSFVQSNIYDRVIVLAEDGQTMNLYKKHMELLGTKEQLLIPFNDGGIKILQAYGKEDVNSKAIKNIYGEDYSKPQWKFADYTVEGSKQVIVLINNDIEKIEKLKQSNVVNAYNYVSKTKYVIVCLEEQEETFKNEFPTMEIRTVPFDVLDAE